MRGVARHERREKMASGCDILEEFVMVAGVEWATKHSGYTDRKFTLKLCIASTKIIRFPSGNTFSFKFCIKILFSQNMTLIMISSMVLPFKYFEVFPSTFNIHNFIKDERFQNTRQHSPMITGYSTFFALFGLSKIRLIGKCL